MDRLFLDANALFSAAYRPDAGLLSLWKLKNVTLCSSRYAIEEARFNVDDNAERARLETLTQHPHLFQAAARDLPSGISLPEKDVPILLAAIETSASHLLTGDVRHFGSHFGRRIAGTLTLLPGEYLRART
jgi:predicted nucleic acid-binding protein